MEIYIYILIFIMGTLFGSFFSLAIYRIPLNQDITHKRSYCPKCQHKLNFMDLIPIISYLFLKGKCRYCKDKIKIKYILLEIFSGIIFLLFAYSLKIDIYNLEIEKLIYLLSGIIYISILFIIAGIDKENHIIAKQVLLVGLICQTAYIIYLYTLNASIYRYVIYLIIMLILIYIDTLILKKKAKSNYTLQILILCNYLAISTKEELVILSIISTLLLVAIKEIMIKIQQTKDIIIKDENEEKVPIGFYLCFSNIAILILQNLLR